MEINIAGWNIIRADRKERGSGGSLLYIKDGLSVSLESNFSNSYVEVAMGFTTNTETALVSIYRPPNCPSAKFTEALAKIEEWIAQVENTLGKSPTLLVSGDLNFPSMKSWTCQDMEHMSANSNARISNDNPVGDDKTQILKLVEFVQKFSLNQEVTEGNRQENILDQIFSSDSELIEEVEIIENSTISHHKFIVAGLDRLAIITKEEQLKNFCTTQIPRYNLKNGTVENWNRAQTDFSEEKKVNENYAVKDLTNEIIKTLDDIVKNNFIVHSPPDRSNKKSGNYIPHDVRCLMKIKINASQTLRNTSDVSKIDLLRTKIQEIEDELRQLVHKKRANDEMKARHNLSKNPINLFKLVKKMLKKSPKIGPLKCSNKTKNWTSAEILSDQYSKVFSTPHPDVVISDEKYFFSAKIGPLKRGENSQKLSDAEILASQYSKVFTTPDRANMFEDPADFFSCEQL